MVGSWSEWSCRAVVGCQSGVDLVADVGEDGFVAAVQVQGGGGADVDDRGDHPRQRCRVSGIDVLVAGEQAGDADLEAACKG